MDSYYTITKTTLWENRRAYKTLNYHSRTAVLAAVVIVAYALDVGEFEEIRHMATRVSGHMKRKRGIVWDTGVRHTFSANGCDVAVEDAYQWLREHVPGFREPSARAKKRHEIKHPTEKEDEPQAQPKPIIPVPHEDLDQQMDEAVNYIETAFPITMEDILPQINPIYSGATHYP